MLNSYNTPLVIGAVRRYWALSERASCWVTAHSTLSLCFGIGQRT